MALPENDAHIISPRDVVRSWAEFLHLVKPPPPTADVVFLETGVAPEGSGRVEMRPIYELDMKDPPIEGQLYLWHSDNNIKLPEELREVAVFIPSESETITETPIIRAEIPQHQPATHAVNLVLGLRLTSEGKR